MGQFIAFVVRRSPCSLRVNDRFLRSSDKLASFAVYIYDGEMPDSNAPPINLEATVTDLSLAVGLLVRRLRQEANAGDLTWSQTSALSRLDRDGPMTTAELARAELVKAQSMGVTLADLEQDGLIERQPHPTDHRQTLLSLTAKGVEVRRKRRIAAQQWLLAAVAKFDPEEQQTLISAIGLLKRLSDP